MDIGTLTGSIQLEDQLSSQLTVMTHRVNQFASSFDGMVGVVLGGSVVIVGAVSAIIGSIVALGMKGSTILGVEQAFDTFAQTVGSTGATMFEALNSGLRGTVDSMEIMQSTTKLLSSGIKVSAADMNIMAKTAREMAKATGTDAATSLNQLSTAVQQGNTRMLRRIGINVDLVKAEKDFAASIGTTRDQLNQAGVQQARANAIMLAFKERLDKTGESALSFKERIQQANVSIGNWFDDLAKGVARSTAVSAAFDAIKNSFVEVFGGTTQTLQKNMLAWIDQFAAGVAKFGPIVIQAFGTVKDWIVQVWNELVAFNDRYQITNNLIAGAKFAWGTLQLAFQLVKSAVQEVIAAWNSMPEWLQRITQTALTASLAVGAFSVGVGTVAAPVAALVSKVDLVINIFGNLSGAIFATLGLLDRFRISIGLTTAVTTASTIASSGWMVALGLTSTAATRAAAATGTLTFVTAAQAATYNAATVAASFYNAVILNIATRLGLLTAATKVNAAFNAVASASYGVLAGAIAWVNSTSVVLGIRMGLAALATKAAGVSAGVTSLSMLGLGSAILLVTKVLIPLVAAYYAWVVAQKAFDWLGWSDKIEYTSLKIQRLVGWIDKAATDQDLWNSVQENTRRRTGETADGYNEAAIAAKLLADEEKRRRDVLSGAFVANEVEKLRQDYASLTAEQQKSIDVQKRVGAAAETLRQQGGRLHPELRALADAYVAANKVAPELTDNFLKGSTAAEDFTKKIADMGRSYQNITAGFTDDAAFTKAFEKLTPKQLENPDLQLQLVPNIDKLISSGKDLADGMQGVRFATQAAQIALVAKDKAVLEAHNLTLTQIDGLKRLGLTEAQIAGNYYVSTEGLQKYTAGLQEAAQNEQNLQTFSAKTLKEQEEAAIRREAMATSANKVIGQSYEELDDLIAKSTMSSTALQIREIKKAQTAREVAFAASVSGLKDAEQLTRNYHKVQERLSEQSINNLLIDQNTLKAGSVASHEEMVASAQVTYMYMAAHANKYTAEAIAAAKRLAEEAKRGFVSFADTIGDALKKIPDMLIDAFIGGGDLVGAMKALAVDLARNFTENFIKSIKVGMEKVGGLVGLTGQQKAFAGGIGAIAGVSAAANGASAAKSLASVGLAAAGVAASTIAAMSAVGTATTAAMASAALTAGAWTAGIGAAAVGAYFLIKHFTTISKEVKETRKQLDEFGDALSETLTEAQKIEAGGVKWKETVIAVRDAYLDVGKTVSEAEDVVKRLWDTSNPARSRAAAAEIAINVALSSNIRSVRTLVQEYLGAGRTIPAALQANIDKLVIMGKLTAENAAAMLEMKDTAVPAYADVEAAAERYGIAVESLGGAVQGLKITEIANQVVSDWELMELAGADMTVVMEGMRDEILDLITDAAKFGTALPAAMKPIIERMDAAGQFTDEFGNSLVNVSELTFAETLEEKIGKIVDAMLLLADVINEKVGGALDNIGSKTINPQINPQINKPSNPSSPDSDSPSYFASGGIAQQEQSRGKLITFRPKGTDTVPAMLTPGETILPAAGRIGEPSYVMSEKEAKASGGSRPIARPTVPEAPTAVRAASPTVPEATAPVVTPTVPEAPTAVRAASPTVPKATAPVVTPTVPEAPTAVRAASPTVPEATAPVVTPTVPEAPTAVRAASPTVPEATAPVVTPTVPEAPTAVRAASPTVPEATTPIRDVTPTVPETTTPIRDVTPTVPKPTTPIRDVTPTKPQTPTLPGGARYVSWADPSDPNALVELPSGQLLTQSHPEFAEFVSTAPPKPTVPVDTVLPPTPIAPTSPTVPEETPIRNVTPTAPTSPTVPEEQNIEAPAIKSGPKTIRTVTIETQYFTKGGVVQKPSYTRQDVEDGAEVIQFTSRGTDTVPAMLTPGERVLSRSQVDNEVGGGTAEIYLDTEMLTRVLVPKFRRESKRYRLSRR